MGNFSQRYNSKKEIHNQLYRQNSKNRREIFLIKIQRILGKNFSALKNNQNTNQSCVIVAKKLIISYYNCPKYIGTKLLKMIKEQNTKATKKKMGTSMKIT